MALYISIIIVSMLVGWILTLIDDGNCNFPYGLTGGILGLIIPVVLLSLIVETTPTALDVYKGKPLLKSLIKTVFQLILL